MRLRQFQLNISFWGRKYTEEFKLKNRKGLVPIFPCFFLKFWQRPCSDGTTKTFLTRRPNIENFPFSFGFKLHSFASHKNSWSTLLKSKTVTVENRYCRGNKGKLLLYLQKFSKMHYSYLWQCFRESPTELSTEASAQEISFVLKMISLYLSSIWFLGYNLKQNIIKKVTQLQYLQRSREQRKANKQEQFSSQFHFLSHFQKTN